MFFSLLMFASFDFSSPSFVRPRFLPPPPRLLLLPVSFLCCRMCLSSSLLRPFPWRHCLQRLFSAPSSHDLELDLSHPTYVVWGANTSVSKTLISANKGPFIGSPNSLHCPGEVFALISVRKALSNLNGVGSADPCSWAMISCSVDNHIIGLELELIGYAAWAYWESDKCATNCFGTTT